MINSPPTTPPPPILTADAVTYGFPQRPSFLKPVTLSISAGQCWGIIGPNGAGKSTLLRLLAGLMAPAAGTIRLDGRPLGDVPPRERARRIAFMPQGPPRELACPVRDVVLMGRYPHRRFGLFEDSADYGIAEDVMRTTGTVQFADRILSTLSGGEAQRVHLAAALAQRPAALLLDEPTAALDLFHQLGIFSLLRELVDGGLAVVVVTHDLNLAGRFCTHVLLLDDGRPVASGPPGDVIRPDRLEPVYRVRLRVLGSGAGRETALIATETVERASQPWPDDGSTP